MGREREERRRVGERGGGGGASGYDLAGMVEGLQVEGAAHLGHG